MYELEFTIWGLPETTNSAGRTHWAVKAKEAKKWRTLVCYAVGFKKPERPLEKAKLTLTRLSSGTIDPDGLVSSFKHIIDGLVECGVLKDDRLANIGFPDYRHETAPPKQGRIKVRIEQA